MVVIDLDVGLYYRPEVGNKLLIGSTEPECDEKIWEDDLDTMDTNNTEQWYNQMYRASLRIPSLQIPNSKNQQYIVSTYDVSDDWTPIYDKSNINGYYMAIGTSGNQLKNAPVVGELMAELVEQCENGLDHDNNPLNYKLKKNERGY
jgi:sarcosine oxidase subunit beta